MRMTRTPRLLLAVATAAAVAAPAAAVAQPPAPLVASAASDAGLYGSADPTYDGVFRQGLAITGLRAAGEPVPRAAVSWLLRQQCDNGGFQSYRASTRTACARPNPATYSGPDSNSTAMAAMALRSAGRTTEAARATGYLRRLQNPDGGFAYFRGGASDVNSTGLALAALRPLSRAEAVKEQIGRAAGYLRKAQLRCSARPLHRGLLAYQPAPGLTMNYLASAQGAIGLVTTLPAKKGALPRATAPLACANGQQVGPAGVRDTLLDALRRNLKAGGGAVPDQFGGGADLASTAQMALALAAAGRGADAVNSATAALSRQARTYSGVAAGRPNAASLGVLLNLVGTTGRDEHKFGGVDLVAALRSSLRR